MRISFSGCAGQGKSTLVKAFLRRWPMYTTPKETYRDIIVKEGLEHSSQTNEETQLHILNWMMEEQSKYGKDSNVVFDRCPLDNLAYTLQGNIDGKISDEVVAATISFVKESMKELDIIFWMPYDERIKLVNDGMRDTDKEYVKKTNKIFEELYDQYADSLESDVFFPKEDCPAIIPIDNSFFTVDDRIAFVAEFIDRNGNLIETTNSILDPSNINLLEQMVKEQEKQLLDDEQIKRVMKQIGKIEL
jgi:predicted ATPase